jgi:predicted GH43/DUF377 family glycosyl hydrolase
MVATGRMSALFAVAVGITAAGETRAQPSLPAMGRPLAEVLAGTWIVDHQVVLAAGPRGSWDDQGVHTPIVLRDGPGYRMYFTGRSGSQWSIGAATSADLRDWKKHPEPLLGSGNRWDAQVDFPWTIKDRGRWFMFFECKLKSAEKQSESVSDVMTIRHMHGRPVGLATSSDGLSFTKHDSPVLQPGPKGQWDSDGLCAPRVFHHEGRYWMFYAGSNGQVARSGLAFSRDLLHWERFEGNPIISVGREGAWDSKTVLFGSVIQLTDGYLAAYEGEDGKKMQIGLAWSRDLVHWTKFSGNPVIRVDQEYPRTSVFVCAPNLVVHEGRLHLFYTHNVPDRGTFCRIEVARLRN